MIWFLGDSAIEAAVRDFAGDQEVFVSAHPNAVDAEIWVEQVHHARGKRWQPPVTAVIYLNSHEYDSELTIMTVADRIPKGSKIILVMLPDSPKVLEGTDHGIPVSVVEYGDNLADKLRAA